MILPMTVEQVLQRARYALSSSPVHGLRDLTLDSIEGGLCISGRVTSFYHKQLAQEIVLGISGSLDVVNRVQVVDSENPHDLQWN